MQDRDETENMTDEQRELLEQQMKSADEAAEALVEQYADDPDLEFVPNPTLIGDGVNVTDMDSSAIPGQPELTPAMIKRIKRMMAGPMSREKQPCKKCVTKETRDKKRRNQKKARKVNRKK